MEDYMDGSVDGDDIFPCKGCGEILEEGKAFELAGNRWHLNCFRCNTCNTLLDSDANLLLLGDGSLICNNCTYSCSACGDKIEDLAILTGEQAFCAACFRCRNCKRKIDNLRYAKTSQGIFCMSCHESLMARRRKKAKAAQAKAREKDGSPMVVEKSLPALPPNAIPPNAFSNDRVDPDSDTPTELPTELSPRPRPSYNRTDSDSVGGPRPARSPERSSDHPGMSLPAHTYRPNRNSALFSAGDSTNTAIDDQSFFIPVALDPSPLPSATPKSAAERARDKDYFGVQKQTERKPDSQSSTPHIAFQEKGRQASLEYDNLPAKSLGRKLSKSSKVEKNGSSNASSVVGDDKSQAPANGKSEEFKLQDAPKSRKLNTRTSSQQSNSFPEAAGSRESGSGRMDKDAGVNEPNQHAFPSERGTPPRNSQDLRRREEDEDRQADPSATTPGNTSRPIARKELPNSASRNVNGLARTGYTDPKPSDIYMTPRAPPAPPGQATTQDPGVGGEHKSSPKLPRWSAGGDFSMEEDMARILGTDEGSSSILRRVSNAVRHGRTSSTESSNLPRAGHTRSASETTRTTASPHWPKTPTAGDSVNGAGHDISSPLSLTSSGDHALLKQRLRTSEQRVAELERQFSNERDLKNLAQKVEEKRKTVSVLDTQTELMIRQLEALAGYVERAKETKKPVDPRDLEESAIKDFVQRLEKLKQSMVASLEQLHAERDQVIEEKIRAMTERDRARADRDSARTEFEQLVSKNAQLADLNNDITHQIQERFKSHSDTRMPPNGLGIYNHNKGSSNHSVSLDNASIQTGTTIITPDHEEPILEARPTVVKIEKKNFSKWKKGSKAVAQNIAKGVNRTVVAFQQPERHPQGAAGESIGLPYNMTVTPIESPVAHIPSNGLNNRQQVDAGRQGFFGFKKAQTLPRQGVATIVTTPIAATEPPNVLFGSELAERAEYERRQIPSVVTRCIEEVELRGMEMEGIYRKTGGNSQVKIIQEGFDKNENFDISDPDMDITAVTSVLKQYFRKLPTPLLTYDIYDRVLETNSLASDSEKSEHLQNVFNQLPRQHKDCLEFLMFHLSRVASRESENLMSPKNLAVVFAPTIMRDMSIEREMTDMHAKNNAVQFIIENSHTIFS